MDITILNRRLQNAEKSIEFLQREHAETLACLHVELAKWQQKYSDLTFNLSMNGTTIHKSDDCNTQSSIVQHDNQLRKYKNKIKNLTQIIEEKDKILNDYETRLSANKEKYELEIQRECIKAKELQNQLEQSSELVKKLSHRLHDEKQRQKSVNSRTQPGPVILQSQPTKFRTSTENRFDFTQTIVHRSSSLNNRSTSHNQDLTALFIGRPSPKPTDSNENYLSTKRQRHSLSNNNNNIGNNDENKSRSSTTYKFTTILPPIVHKPMPLKALPTTIFRHEDAT